MVEKRRPTDFRLTVAEHFVLTSHTFSKEEVKLIRSKNKYKQIRYAKSMNISKTH